MIYQERVIKKFRKLSEQYHRLSFLMYELANSLEYFSRREQSVKAFKEEVKKLNIDINKLLALQIMEDIKLKDLKK